MRKPTLGELVYSVLPINASSVSSAFASVVTKLKLISGVNLHTDNKPDKLLKAYLRLAKQATSYEDEIELLIETLDGL